MTTSGTGCPGAPSSRVATTATVACASASGSWLTEVRSMVPSRAIGLSS